MKGQRIALGIIGALMLVTALIIYFSAGMTDDNAFFVGICSRVGLVLLAVFLAWPSFQKPIERAPAVFFGMLLAMLVAMAWRPRLALVLFAVGMLALGVNFLFRLASKHLGGDKR